MRVLILAISSGSISKVGSSRGEEKDGEMGVLAWLHDLLTRREWRKSGTSVDPEEIRRTVLRRGRYILYGYDRPFCKVVSIYFGTRVVGLGFQI